MKRAIIAFFLINSISFSFENYQNKILNLMNIKREKKGLKPLKLDKKINKLCIIKSNDMVENNYFSHTSKKYGTPFQMLKKNGINYLRAGENIAMGQMTEEEVFKCWMESKGHRENILEEKYTTVGIGRDKYNKNIWTEIFIEEKKK